MRKALSLVAAAAAAQLLAAAAPAPAAQASPPSRNMPAPLHAAGRYFATPDGKAIYLAGSHTWNDGQELGGMALDFEAYLNLLGTENGNIIRYWVAESPAVGGAHNGSSLLPYARTDSGKFDLTWFNQAYFDAMRAKVQAAGAKGIYVSIMLFNGFSVDPKGGASNPWMAHPYNAANNVNGIDGDPDRTGSGLATQTLADPKVLALQEAYVAKVIATVGDMPNVLFEVANETKGTPAAMAWQNAIVDFIHRHEARNGGPRHPVGMTAPWPASESAANAALFASRADWISPSGIDGGYHSDPPDAPGTKVVLADTDHIFGEGGSADWVWQFFTRGYNVLYMDSLSGTGIRGHIPPSHGDAQKAWERSARLGIAETRQVSTLLDLGGMKPSDGLSSTRYALADPSAGEYVVYAPAGGAFMVDLSGSAGQVLDARWMDIRSGRLSPAFTIVPGDSDREMFHSPHGPSALVLTPGDRAR